ncbi:MAG: YopX family protein [Acutalibacteraceae bacterium]
MREILFRGKRVANGKWIEGYIFAQHNLTERRDDYYIRAYDTDYLVIPETVGQYTGLADKNGVKIFEGDILKGFEYPFCCDGEFDYFAEIVWFENSPAFGTYTFKNPKSNVRGISEGNTDYLENFNSGEWEIIGNIHDNPELIKGGEE